MLSFFMAGCVIIFDGAINFMAFNGADVFIFDKAEVMIFMGAYVVIFKGAYVCCHLFYVIIWLSLIHI